MRAWIFQDSKQVKKLGAEKASWYVGWYDPDGNQRSKSCGRGTRGHQNAEKFQRRIEGELAAGTYQHPARKTWKQFRKEYEDVVLGRLSVRSQREVKTALAHFERIVRPKKMAAIRTAAIDRFITRRRQEAGKKEGTCVSPATVNKDLRHIRAALRKAAKWGYLREVPDIDFEREPEKLPRYVTPEHFAAIYAACETAKRPSDLHGVQPADWWRGLIVMAYMTGWRISELLALRWRDLDLEAGRAVTRHEDNKGRRDEVTALHQVVIQHLKRLSASRSSHVFAWNYNRRTLDTDFRRIQQNATVKGPDGKKKKGLHLPCDEDHVHTPACHVYGFHDLRRAFATMNADRISPEALQALMRHRSYLTTRRYIAFARQIDAAVQSLHVPDVLKGGTKE